MKKKNVLKNNEGEDSNNIKYTKSTFKKIMSIIEYVIICVVVFCNSFLIGRTLKNPNKTPDLFGKKAFIIVSGSMVPTLEIGDVVIIQDASNPIVGDIIAYKKESITIVHRVIKEMNVNDEVQYQTKGDHNSVADPELVKSTNIEGIYITKIPRIGNILMFLYDNLAIVVIIIVVILLIKYLLVS